MSVLRIALTKVLLILVAVLALGVVETTSGGAETVGDVNCSGYADTADVIALLQDAGGLPTSALCLPEAGDTDCDGDRDASDALRILLVLAGRPVPTIANCGEIEAPPEVGEVLPDLEFLGDLASVASRGTHTIGPAGATIGLSDGASVEAPSGAFPGDTALTVTKVGLDVASYIPDATDASIYVLSTEQDVALGAPVVLDIPKPPDTVTVSQLDGDDLVEVDVPDGASTRIEVDHFSSLSYLILEESDGELELDPSVPEPEGLLVSEAFVSCTQMVQSILIGLFPELLDDGDISIYLTPAMTICVEALINIQKRGGGNQTDVDCVADSIDGDTHLEDAVNLCTADKYGGTFDSGALRIDPDNVIYHGSTENTVLLFVPPNGRGPFSGEFVLTSRQQLDFYYASSCWVNVTFQGTMEGFVDIDAVEPDAGIYRDALQGTAELAISYEIHSGTCDGHPPIGRVDEVPVVGDWATQPGAAAMLEILEAQDQTLPFGAFFLCDNFPDACE